MNDITFNILKIVVSVVTALIGYYAIPYIKQLIESNKNAEIITMVEIAVRAAEQTVKGQGLGSVKKEDVTIFMTNWLTEKGIKISEKQLSDLIEAAVFELNLTKK